jgi:hypothetical protein
MWRPCSLSRLARWRGLSARFEPPVHGATDGRPMRGARGPGTSAMRDAHAATIELLLVPMPGRLGSDALEIGASLLSCTTFIRFRFTAVLRRGTSMR